MDALEIYCPICQAACPSSNVNIAALIAKCDHCDSVFHLNLEGENSPWKPLRPSRPDSVTVLEEFDSDVCLVHRWRSWTVIPMIFFCLFWDGFMIFWYAAAVTMLLAGNMAGGAMALFGIFHLAAGIGMTYLTAATLVNRTWIRLQGGMLTVQHGPIPWRQPAPLETSLIDGFEIDLPGWRANSDWRRGILTFNFGAQMSDRSQKVLLRGVNAQLARYVGDELATALQLPLQDNTLSATGIDTILSQFRSQVPAGLRKKFER